VKKKRQLTFQKKKEKRKNNQTGNILIQVKISSRTMDSFEKFLACCFSKQTFLESFRRSRLGLQKGSLRTFLNRTFFSIFATFKPIYIWLHVFKLMFLS